MLAARKASLVESVVRLRTACSAERSEGMLVALGAQITISELVAGRVAARLEKACHWLYDWCVRAGANGSGHLCSPSAYVFLLTSWLEARKVDGNSDWLSFVNGRAVNNRLAFHEQLMELQDVEIGADEETIKGHTVEEKFSGETDGGEVPTCTVCMSEFEVGDDVRKLKCGHRYHAACVDQWLKINKTCPMCKQEIDA